MASASQRYLSFELGSGDHGALKGIFNLSVYAYIGVAFLALIICETIGLWFLNTQMTISSERIILIFIYTTHYSFKTYFIDS